MERVARALKSTSDHRNQLMVKVTKARVASHQSLSSHRQPARQVLRLCLRLEDLSHALQCHQMWIVYILVWHLLELSTLKTLLLQQRLLPTNLRSKTRRYLPFNRRHFQASLQCDQLNLQQPLLCPVVCHRMPRQWTVLRRHRISPRLVSSHLAFFYCVMLELNIDIPH